MEAVDRRGTAEGRHTEGIDTAFPGFAVSPDGKFVAAIGPDHKGVLFPIKAAAASIAGLVNGEFPLRFSATANRSSSGSVTCPHASTRSISRAAGTILEGADALDPSGVERISNVVVTPDGKSYAYTYSRLLSDLFVVEGLK